MDFLSIRKKARERSEAKPAPTAEPRPEEVAPAEARAPTPDLPGERVPGVEAPPPPGGTEPPAPPAEAVGSAAPGPEAPPRAERRRGERRRTRGDEPVLTEEDLLEGALQARFQGLEPTPDGRFATWRPGSGPPPIEPDPGTFSPARTPRARPPAEEEPAPKAALESVERPRRGARPGRSADEDPLSVFFYRPDEDAEEVPLLGGGGGEEPEATAPETLDEYLIFTLGGEEYGVGIGHVREVLRAPAITEVPRAPVHVLGVVTVRGEVVAVVDARRRLGLPGGEGQGAGSRIVIVETGMGSLGLLVETVANVVRLPRGSIEPCPQGISSVASECVTGIGRWRDRLFMVVDVATLLGRARPEEAR